MAFQTNLSTALSRALVLVLLLGLVACTDPLDRIQGEPSEASPTQTEETHKGEHY